MVAKLFQRLGVFEIHGNSSRRPGEFQRTQAARFLEIAPLLHLALLRW